MQWFDPEKFQDFFKVIPDCLPFLCDVKVGLRLSEVIRKYWKSIFSEIPRLFGDNSSEGKGNSPSGNNQTTEWKFCDFFPIPINYSIMSSILKSWFFGVKGKRYHSFFNDPYIFQKKKSISLTQNPETSYKGVSFWTKNWFKKSLKIHHKRLNSWNNSLNSMYAWIKTWENTINQ